MHSNKKDDNGWVLCPSKSLPGKFYYFNVVSGEAVWSLPDAKAPPKNEIENVAEKSHSFPEPEPEPLKQNDMNIASYLPQSINKTTVNKHDNQPMFGQISFPKYMPNVNLGTSKNYNCSTIFMSNNNDNISLFGQGTPKVVWAPLPLVVLEPSGTQTLDQVTQTCELDKVIVHSCDTPLSKRFINYENTTIHFTEENKLIKNNIYTSTPIKPNPIFDPVKPTIDQKIKKRPLIRDPILNIKNLKISDTKCCGTSNLFLLNQNEKKEQNIFQNKKKSFAGLNFDEKNIKVATKVDDEESNLVQLDRNDLRLFLMARKRRHTEGETSTGSSEMKKIKLKYTDDHAELRASKKKVTFASNSPQQVETHKETSNDGILTIKTLRSLAQSNCRRDVWYIVVDMHVLLENYEFLNSFVLSDETCRLLIPEAMRRDIEAMCAGDSVGRTHVYTARQITRTLKDPPRHLVVRTNMTDAGSIEFYSDTNMATSDDILNCCLQTMKQKYHVVLLSNDEDLFKKASVLHIHVYKFEMIKDSPNKPNKICDLNTNKSNLFLSTKFQTSRSHKMFQNIPGLVGEMTANTIRPNNKSIFDDDSVTTEMTSEINRVIQTLNVQNRVPNEDNQKNPFLFQKPCSLSLTSQTKDANKDTSSNNKNQFLSENRITDQKPESQWPNVNMNVPNSNKNSIDKDNEKIKNMDMSVENNLRRFYITYKAMEGTIKERVEEWSCIFTQIMEDALCYVLQNSSFRADLILPWTLQEMIERIKLLYKDRLMLNVIVDKLLACMSQCMTDRGKVNPDIKPQVFIRTMGCGMLLIQCLKNLQPDCEELANAKQSLMNLLRTIENPIEIEFNNTPKTSRSNVDEERRQNYIKQPSEIIRYLKRHYEVWRSYDEMADPEPKRCNMTSDEYPKVFRISGKHLNMLKIDNKNTMTITKCPNGTESKTLECNSKNLESSNIVENRDISAGPKLLKQNNRHLESEKGENSTFIKGFNTCQQSDIIKPNTYSISNQEKVPIKDLNVLYNDNTFDRIKSGPKVTRRVSLIKEYEEKLIRKSLDMDALDYSEIISDCGVNKNENRRNTLSDNMQTLNDSKETDLIDVSNHSTNVDYTKNDSGYNNSQNTDVITNLLKSNNKKKIFNSKDSEVNKGVKTVEKDYISISDYSTITPMNVSAIKTTADKNYSEIYKNISKNPKNDSNDSGVNKIDCVTVIDHISVSDNSVNNTKGDTNDNKPKMNTANVPTKTQCDNSDSAKNKSDYIIRKDYHDLSVSDTTSDSGIGKDSHMAYSFVKVFLSQLSCTFITTHDFMVKNLEALREERLSNDQKTRLHEKIGKAIRHMGDIINELKSIIQRESNGNVALHTLLTKVEEAVNDKRITRYRSVIRKCLEQAQNLQNALKIMHSVTDVNWDGSVSDQAESISSSIRYLNIFE